MANGEARRALAEAEAGRFEVEPCPGWLAGRPTYALAAEADHGAYPEPLRESAPPRWEALAAAALEEAEAAAQGGEVARCAGLLARAAVAGAQARLAREGEWAASEGGILERAGLRRVDTILAATGDRPYELGRAVAAVRTALRQTRS